MNKKINIFQNIVLCILLAFIVVFLIFFNRLEISDELWNFQNLCKMSNGYKIYTDANVIITPIFFYIGHILFTVLKANILTFRIYNIIIYSLIFIVVYKILKNLKISKNLILIYLALIFEFTFSVITAGANYNILAIVFVLIGLNLYICKKSNNFIQGILIFLIFFTKQNLGAIYALTIIIYELYLNKFSKKFIGDQFKKFFFFLIPTCFILLYMYIDGNLLDFINYAFGGILDFGKNNNAFIAYGYYSFIPLVVLAVYIFIVVKRKEIFKEVINEEIFDNLTLLFIFSMGMTLIVYPIMNSAHFTMIMPIYLIFICYLFGILLFEELFSKDKYIENIKWLTITIIFILVLRIIFNIFTSNESTFINDKNSSFYGIYVYNEIIEKSNEIENYIIEKNNNGIDVIILSHDAAYPMINLKQSHGFYDLLFYGNLGYNGIEKIKYDIDSRENTEFLVVTDDKDIFWQEPTEIREYIINNLNYVGTISNYSIYSTNK